MKPALSNQLNLALHRTAIQFSETLRLSREFKPTTGSPADDTTGTQN